MCAVPLNHLFLIFTCDSSLSISADENGLILRYTFKCCFSRSDGSFKRNIQAQNISVHHFINHNVKKKSQFILKYWAWPAVILPGNLNTRWNLRTDFFLNLPQLSSLVLPYHPLALTPSYCSKQHMRRHKRAEWNNSLWFTENNYDNPLITSVGNNTGPVYFSILSTVWSYVHFNRQLHNFTYFISQPDTQKITQTDKLTNKNRTAKHAHYKLTWLTYRAVSWLCMLYCF